MMSRVNILLLLVLIACAASVVTSQHRARKLFTELESQQEAARKLDQEWRELQIESQTLATNKRIEQKATQALGMRLPDPGKTVIVILDDAAPAPKVLKP
jgi:cell division protein FtsL